MSAASPNRTPNRLWTRLRLLATGALVLLVAALAGVLAERYERQSDWTADARNTLSPASQAVVEALEDAPVITVFARDEGQQRERIRRFLRPYERALPELTVEFVNPDLVPQEVQEAGIRQQGTLLVRYQGRTERVAEHTEQAMTNALQRLLQAEDRFLVFLTGHGERDPYGEAPRDLGNFVSNLSDQGINVQTLNLAEHPAIPDNTSALVLASPRHALMPREVEAIRDYLARGGNLLWLTEPEGPDGMAPLKETLGLAFIEGVIVDPRSEALGLEHPAILVNTDYPDHPALNGLSANTAFPFATGMVHEGDTDWEAEPLFRSSQQSWAETGDLEGDLVPDPARDTTGPLTFGKALTRTPPAEEPANGVRQDPAQSAPEQRVAVLGTGHFIANAFLGSGANQDLGLALTRWVLTEDDLVHIPAQAAPDRHFELGEGSLYAVGFGLLFGLPILFLVAGVAIWAHRRRQ